MDRVRLDDVVHGFPKAIVTHGVAKVFYARAEGRAEKFAGFGGETEFVAVLAGAFKFGSVSEMVARDSGSGPGQAPGFSPEQAPSISLGA